MSLGTEEDPRLLATTHGVGMCRRQTSEEGIELSGRDPRLPTCGSRLDGLFELVDVATLESRDVDPRSPGVGLHVTFDLALQVTTTLVVGQIPLVVGDDHRASGLFDHGEDAQILVTDRLRGIDDDDAHLGALGGRLGT